MSNPNQEQKRKLREERRNFNRERSSQFQANPEPQPTSEPYDAVLPVVSYVSTVLVDNCENVNLREHPAKTALVVTKLSKGTQLIVNNRRDGWVFVQSASNPSHIGYVMEAYVTSED
jgi:uncharacterized protein YgiM (DUF1202 family)